MRRFLLALLLPVLATAQPLTVEGPCHVYFSPNGGATNAIVALLDTSKESVRVLAYSFTSKPVGAALVAAKARGVDVQVVLDKTATEKNSLLPVMREAGIPTYIDRQHKILHDKVIVVDGAVFQTGSFNFSASAENNNAENVLICPSASGAAAYLADWTHHQHHAERVQ